MVAPGTRWNDDACYLPSENGTGRATGRRTASTRDRLCPREDCGHLPRYLKRERALWTFVHVEGVEPTNNLGERQVRHSVLWRKMCFGTQSEAGSRFAERIMTVVAALKQQERSAFGIPHRSPRCCQLGAPCALSAPDVALPERLPGEI